VSVTDRGWYPDPWEPTRQRWWDGSAWTGHVAPLSDPVAECQSAFDPSEAHRRPTGGHRTDREKGAALEQQVAAYMSSLGYAVRTNVILEGRSGANHEIDVLGEKQDDFSTSKVAIECKAWDQPIEKDVVAKFDYVLRDLGLRQGVVVALGGSRSGADIAARELGITIWGVDELREKLGSVAVADLKTQAPKREALGLEIRLDQAEGSALIAREARGKMGFGAETVVWHSLVWMPVTVVQLACSRVEGRIKKVTQTRRQWNSYNRVDGGLVHRSTTPPSPVQVDLGACSVRPKQRASSATKEIEQAVKKYNSVSTEQALARHRSSLLKLGVPSDFTIVTESTSELFVPLYVANAERKSGERLIVVDAHRGEIHGRLSDSLSHNIQWLWESVR
jgi:hypothetical protein